LVELKSSTLDINKKKYKVKDNLPGYSLTLGIYNIFKAKRVLVLASGKEKSEEVKDFIEGYITKLLPVSILKLHKDLTVILDEGSANTLNKEIRQIIK